MSNLKSFIRNWCPPVVRKMIQPKSLAHIHFPNECSSWAEAELICSGYDSPEIVNKVLGTTIKVLNGEYAYERDSVGFLKVEYSWPVLCGLLLAASTNENNLSVLDFGGGLGGSFFQNQRFLSGLSSLNWSVVEQSAFVNAGNEKVKFKGLHFYNSINECVLERHPNAILLSSVLQYINNYQVIINEVTRIGAEFIIIDRTPFLKNGSTEKIFTQQVPDWIYRASYPCRFFVKNDLIKIFESKGYFLLESFDSLDDLDDRAKWRGYIFRRINSKV